MKKTMIVLILVLFSLMGINTMAYVILYPGVTFYGGDLTVTFSNSDGVNTSYFEVGNSYVVFDEINISVSCTGSIAFNFSQYNGGHSLTPTEKLIRFNSTYTGTTATFSFSDNDSNNYYLYIDNVFSSVHTGNFSWTYTSWSTHDFYITELVYPDPPYNASSSYNSTANSINLTWQRGNYSDTEVLVKKTTGYPSDPMDGTIVQNSTVPYYVFNITEDAYYTVWSYNSTSNTFSHTGLNLPWGALTINVFNASRTWEKIDPFGLTIQNLGGTSIYTNTSVSPPVSLSLDEIPIGSSTIFIINSSGYKTQTFRRDTVINTFMNYTFLIPPVETTTEGEGDTDPVTGDPTNFTDSQLYLITLLNEVDQSLPDGLIAFNIYVNATDSYEQVGSFITDGAGQGTIWLVPNKLYKVDCSVPDSDDYQTSTSYWTPSNLVLTKTFKLKYTEDDIQPAKIPQDYITFTASRTNTSLTIIYIDALAETINTTLYVYEINTTTGIETLFYTNTTTGIDSFSLDIDGLTANNSYRISLNYNHSTFGYQDPTILLAGFRRMLATPTEFNTMMIDIFGFNPLTWSHLVMFIILVLGMFFADPKDAGKVLIILGGIFIFINTFIGFDDTLTVAAGGIIPGLFILVGLLIEWNNRKV